jgi:hypothetical protein
MPVFDLGNLRVNQDLNAPPEQAFDLSKQILEGYKRRGFHVSFTRQTPPREIAATFSNNDGTRIQAEVKLSPSGNSRTRLAIQLKGKVYVGGIKGAFADDEKVNKAAKEMLIKAIREALQKHGVQGALETVCQREAVYCHAQQRSAGRS